MLVSSVWSASSPWINCKSLSPTWNIKWQLLETVLNTFHRFLKEEGHTESFIFYRVVFKNATKCQQNINLKWIESSPRILHLELSFLCIMFSRTSDALNSNDSNATFPNLQSQCHTKSIMWPLLFFSWESAPKRPPCEANNSHPTRVQCLWTGACNRKTVIYDHQSAMTLCTGPDHFTVMW